MYSVLRYMLLDPGLESVVITLCTSQHPALPFISPLEFMLPLGDLPPPLQLTGSPFTMYIYHGLQSTRPQEQRAESAFSPIFYPRTKNQPEAVCFPPPSPAGAGWHLASAFLRRTQPLTPHPLSGRRISLIGIVVKRRSPRMHMDANGENGSKAESETIDALVPRPEPSSSTTVPQYHHDVEIMRENGGSGRDVRVPVIEAAMG